MTRKMFKVCTNHEKAGTTIVLIQLRVQCFLIRKYLENVYIEK